MSNNKNLRSAKSARDDERYTQLVDIENELAHYKDFFKDKIVLCNCDDPYESNFFKFFAMRFNAWGIKKLIATCYAGSPLREGKISIFDVFPIDTGDGEDGHRKPYKIEINQVMDANGDGAIDLADVEWLLRNDRNVLTILEGDGDYKSEECIKLLDEADVVVTNPPWSKFIEFIDLLIQHNKYFLILGNKSSITYKSVFPLIMQNKMWLGMTPMSCEMYFDAPDSSIQEALAKSKKRTVVMHNGRWMMRAQAVWYTNLENKKRHDGMTLYKHYSEAEYPMYDNYDAIEVSKTPEIPEDYFKTMGVPITFLDKYNPEQFEIIGMAKRGAGDPSLKTRVYTKDDYENYSDLNAGPVLMQADGKPKNTFPRILIRRLRNAK